MTSQPNVETQNRDKSVHDRTRITQGRLEFVVFGCLLTGTLTGIKAVQMEQFADALLCLLGSALACGLVCYLGFQRN